MPRVPKLLSGPSPSSLNLSPPEAYLLSLVDGMLDEQELAVVTGMTPPQVAALVDRLIKLGAVEASGGSAAGGPSIPPAPGPASAPAAAAHKGPVFDGPPKYDPVELDEPAELEPEKKRRILDFFYRLDELTYYELLGVAPDADKKQIKAAYYAVAPDFHPDKFFRKQLGSYRPKIEAIFARFTLAQDVLTVAQRRTEYDEYLAQTQRNRNASAVLDQAKQEVEAILAAVEQAAAQALAAQQAAAPQASRPASGRAPLPVAPTQGLSQEELLRQRREALARKLMGGRRPGAPGAAPSQPTAPAPMDPAIAERASEALRQRQEAAIADAKRAQVNKYLEAGRAAMASADFAGAANSFRIASSLAPDDAAVQASCNEALQKVAVALADGYWKQALYEEGNNRWAEAALSFSKVCTGRPDDAHAHERVAFATLKSAGNSRRAVDFARRAIELEPKRPEFRVTLARAYAAAGLEKSASSELDRALELGPKDPKVQALVAAAREALTAGPAAGATPEGAPPPKQGGLSGLFQAVRAALAPKEGK